jgi:hypothetical protein
MAFAINSRYWIPAKNCGNDDSREDFLSRSTTHQPFTSFPIILSANYAKIIPNSSACSGECVIYSGLTTFASNAVSIGLNYVILLMWIAPI